MMANRRQTLVLCLLSIAFGHLTRTVSADSPTAKAPPGIKTFSAFPRTDIEVAAAHRAAKGQVVDFLPEGEAVTITTFTPYLTQRDRNDKSLRLPDVSIRQPVLSVAIKVAEEDQVDIPQLSKASILNYLAANYVTLQARIQKDAGTRELYLHHRPLVATVKFGKIKLTEEFVPAVVDAVRDIHSLGLYLPAKTPPIPANLRTAVMVHSHRALDMQGNQKQRYEFLILRARPGKREGLNIHAFATSDDRKQLHYLKTGGAPQRVRDCSLQATVRFTKYSGGQLIPAESVVRRYNLDSQATFSIERLDKFVQQDRKLDGDVWDHLNEVLDEIIDGGLKHQAASSLK
jgi:hypothetical protein